jgi:uncharacterized UPF0160 family protein
MEIQRRKRTLAVHDGAFHADEITAAALLLLYDMIDIDKIYRTRDQSVIKKSEYVCDVGGIYDPDIKRFDHHQSQYVGEMSSAGMILLYLKDKKIISPELYRYFNDALIIGVDADDNGRVKLKRGFCSFSQAIANFLPVEYDASEEKRDQSFKNALTFVIGHLKRLQERYYYNERCKVIVKKVMDKSKHFLIFDEAISWMDSFFALGGEKHSAVFVVMPTQDHWKLRGIPPSMNKRMKVRIPQPSSWAGLHEADLKKQSKIDGAIFCHKGLFISIWETKKDAINALKFVLKENGISYE